MYNMNKLNNSGVSNSLQIPTQSVFSDKRQLDGEGRNNIFQFLRDIFVELWEKTGDKLYLKHMILQNVLGEYMYGEDLETFLQNNGFDLYHNFQSIEDLQFSVEKNSGLLREIKSWKLNMWILFNGLVPVGIILAKKNLSDTEILSKIHTLRENFKNSLWDVLTWIDLHL